jgi:hypothetical protein
MNFPDIVKEFIELIPDRKVRDRKMSDFLKLNENFLNALDSVEENITNMPEFTELYDFAINVTILLEEYGISSEDLLEF